MSFGNAARDLFSRHTVTATGFAIAAATMLAATAHAQQTGQVTTAHSGPICKHIILDNDVDNKYGKHFVSPDGNSINGEAILDKTIQLQSLKLLGNISRQATL
jgi:hypothetical protein